MSFKDFLLSEGSSVYKLCKDTGLPQSTVNEFGKSKDIGSMKLDMAAIVAAYFKITIDELYTRCKE